MAREVRNEHSHTCAVTPPVTEAHNLGRAWTSYIAISMEFSYCLVSAGLQGEVKRNLQKKKKKKERKKECFLRVSHLAVCFVTQTLNEGEAGFYSILATFLSIYIIYNVVGQFLPRYHLLATLLSAHLQSGVSLSLFRSTSPFMPLS